MNVSRLVSPALLLAAILCALPACNTLEGIANMMPNTPSRGEAPPKLPKAQKGIISAIPDFGRLVVLRDNKTIAVLKPSKTLVERYGFWKGTEQVVIRSTDNSGESVIELFNVQGAQRVDGMLASKVTDKPDWAASVK